MMSDVSRKFDVSLSVTVSSADGSVGRLHLNSYAETKELSVVDMARLIVEADRLFQELGEKFRGE